MRKIISLFLAGIMLLSLTGCGASKPTPEDAVSNYIEAVKTNNEEELKKQPISLDSMKEFKDLSEDDMAHEMKDELLSMFKDIEYKVNDSEISEDGKTAIVNASITNADFGSAIEEWYSDLMSIAFTEPNEKKAEDKLLKALKNRFEGAKENDPKTIDVKVKLTKKDDDTWEIDKKGNDDLLNALTGNMMKTIKRLSDLFE